MVLVVLLFSWFSCSLVLVVLWFSWLHGSRGSLVLVVLWFSWLSGSWFSWFSGSLDSLPLPQSLSWAARGSVTSSVRVMECEGEIRTVSNLEEKLANVNFPFEEVAPAPVHEWLQVVEPGDHA